MTVATGRGWAMYRGDCLDVMATLDGIDHVMTDPPYEAEAHTQARRALVDSTQRRGAVNTGKVRRIDQPLEIHFEAITADDRRTAAADFARLASRWVLAFCQVEAVGAWRDAYVDAGLDWVRGGVWRKPDGAPQFTGDRPGQGFECVAIGHRAGRKRWNGGGTHAHWTYPLEHARNLGTRAAHGLERAEHPTIKPIGLMLHLVSLFTDPGDMVLDPFAGSGTTGVACLRQGRQFIGIERDERYFDLACERLRAEEAGNTVAAARRGQIALFGSTG